MKEGLYRDMGKRFFGNFYSVYWSGIDLQNQKIDNMVLCKDTEHSYKNKHTVNKPVSDWYKRYWNHLPGTKLKMIYKFWDRIIYAKVRIFEFWKFFTNIAI